LAGDWREPRVRIGLSCEENEAARTFSANTAAVGADRGPGTILNDD
jgi:hypothetical protein